MPGIARCRHPLWWVRRVLRPGLRGDGATGGGEGGGPGGFLLPFRLLGSGASWGEITSSPACPPPPQLPLPMAPFSLPRAQCWWGREVKRGRGGSLALGVPAASLTESGPLGFSASLGLGGMAGAGAGSVQPGGPASLYSSRCAWAKELSCKTSKDGSKWEPGGQMSSNLITSFCLS